MEAEDRPKKLVRYLCGFTVPKQPDDPNEDHWKKSDDGTVCAVSDGASVSFDPGTWADILTQRFIENQDVGADWIDAAVASYRAGKDRDVMEWMQQAAYDRGSFATLLGAVSSPNLVRVCAVGDSLAALIIGDQIAQTLPYDRAEQFDQSPRLLSTNPIENRPLKEDELPKAWHELDLTGHADPIVVLVTDALGRWLLDGPDRVSSLLTIGSDDDFAQFVERERSEGRLKKDDTTLIVMGVAS